MANRTIKPPLFLPPLPVAVRWVFRPALLHKWFEGCTSPFPRQTYPTVSVTGMPRAVYRLRTAIRILSSATCRSKSRAMRPWPNCLTQFIFVSARLRRWYLVSFHQSARPRYLQALTASFRAIARAVVGLQSWAFLRGGMTAAAPRAAITLWHLRVS